MQSQILLRHDLEFARPIRILLLLAILSSAAPWMAPYLPSAQYLTNARADSSAQQMYPAGLAILCTALAFSALSESLRIALDPTMKHA